MRHIAVLIGSLRKDSINRKYIEDIRQLLPGDVQFNFVDIHVPLFSQDLEAGVPESVHAMKEVIKQADGVLFVTPEYNRGYPGVLKNAIDWASRPYGANSFDGKPAAILGVSGSLGTTQAQQQLRNVLVYLNTKLLGQPEMYINHSVAYEDGQLTDQAREYARAFLETFVAHIAQTTLSQHDE